MCIWWQWSSTIVKNVFSPLHMIQYILLYCLYIYNCLFRFRLNSVSKKYSFFSICQRPGCCLWEVSILSCYLPLPYHLILSSTPWVEGGTVASIIKKRLPVFQVRTGRSEDKQEFFRVKAVWSTEVLIIKAYLCFSSFIISIGNRILIR